jgi:glutamyl-tRNA synthetase
MTQVITRIPPSPTGHLHVGTARTALFNYLFAKQQGGKVVFRSEDTDRARSTKESEEEIIEGLHWLGLSWDEFSRQSERASRHQELLEKMVSAGKAYISKEPAKDDPTREVEVIRLVNPGKEVIFEDLIRGPINTHTGELGDFVIARSIDDPLYHFAVVVDDMDAGVTHVIRGEDHISNTARQILIQEALEAPRPQYAHLPLVLNSNRTKLSKRDGITSVMDYKTEGILPEAFINYIAFLGWNPGDDREIFSLAELVEAFDLSRVQKSGAIWDREKLLSINQHWMRMLSTTDFITRGDFTIGDPQKLEQVVPLLKDRAHTFGEAREMLAGELRCLFEEPALSQETLLKKELPDRPGLALSALKALLEAVKSLPGPLSPEAAKEALMPLAEAEEAKGKGGRGAVLWPLRYALSGEERSPDPFTLISILGPLQSAVRIQKAIAILER